MRNKIEITKYMKKNITFALAIVIVIIFYVLTKNAYVVYISTILYLSYILFEDIRDLKKMNIKNSSRFLSYTAIVIYLLVYFFLFNLRGYYYYQSFNHFYLLKSFLATLFLSTALIGFKTGKGWLRGFPLTKTEALIIHIIEIIAVVWLFIFI